MPPDNRFEPGRWRTRPAKTKISSNLLQSIGERREVDMRKNERKKVHRILDSGRGCRVIARHTMTFAHSFQEDRLVAAEMNEPRIRDRRKDIEEFAPYALLPVLVIGPKAVLNSIFPDSEANPDQVVEIAIRQTFNVQIDASTVEFRFQEIDGMYLILANRERPQRVMK